MTRHYLVLFASLWLIASLGCSSKDSTPAVSATGVSTLANLPKATGAVGGSGASSLSILSGASAMLFNGSLSGGVSASAATTGTKLKDFDDSATWTGGKSRALCELGTMTREILREAAGPDKTLCYIGKMQTLGKFGTVDDGSFKYFTITTSGSPMMRVKFKIVKDGAGAITNYEMFTCQYSGGSYAMQEYLSQVITGSSASITAKNIGSDSSGGSAFTWSSLTTVTGTINTSGVWTTKVIDATRNFTYDGAGASDGSFNQKITLTQGESSMIIDGFNNSSFYNSAKGGGAGISSFSMRMYGKVQLLASSGLPTMAFGEGSAKAIMSFDGGDIGGGGLGTAVTAHWNGDTRVAAGTSDYAAAIASVSPRADDGTVSVSFTGAQTWNCSDTGSSSFSSADITAADMTTIQACDSVYGFGSGESGGSNACFAM